MLRCRRKNKEGRHVGLDFYDLLIEAHSGDGESGWSCVLPEHPAGVRAGRPTEADPRGSRQTKSAGDDGVGCTRDSAFGSCPKRMDPNTVQAVLAKLQAPPLGQIADTHVVLGLEELAGPNKHEAA